MTRWLVGRVGRAGSTASGALSLAIESALDIPYFPTPVLNSVQQRLNSGIGPALQEHPITVYGTAVPPAGTLTGVRVFLDHIAIRDVVPSGGTWQYGSFDVEDYVDHLFFVPEGTHTIGAATIDTVNGVSDESETVDFTIVDGSVMPRATITSLSTSSVAVGGTVTINGTITGIAGATAVNAYWCIDGYAVDFLSVVDFPGSSTSFSVTVTIPTDTWNPLVSELHSMQLIAIDNVFGQGDWSNSVSLTIT